MPMRRINVRLPEEVLEALESVAANTSITVSQLIRKILVDWVREQGYRVEKIFSKKGDAVASKRLLSPPRLQTLPKPTEKLEEGASGTIITLARRG